ncbi:SirB1 family protein [Derxia gummosa]|uniref:SirB1 family protein n=1 Tax=Derxia gummosa DSM 723 TaxID=1121388 RepID=A0A8B6X1W1_9BURK|nr:tetratricopeptide repeat protein [Derxia gummosa]
MTVTPISTLDYWAMLVGEDDSLPLFEAAASVAQDAYPGLDLEPLLDAVDSFAARLRGRLTDDATVVHKLRMLNHLFFGELHFRGNANDYHDPENSYLNRVIDRRCGIPITLAILYIEIGRQAGIPLQGVCFPGHYLVKTRANGGEVFIDVFDQGRSLSRGELEARLVNHLPDDADPTLELGHHLHSARPRETLARMLRNLKMIHLRDDDWGRLLPVQQRLVALLPDEPTELRDRGFVYSRLDCPRAAIADFEAYLDAAPDCADGPAVRVRIDELRPEADRLN